MLDLVHIRDILAFQRKQYGEEPEYMTEEADQSCAALIEAIDEGRVQITPKAK